MAAKRQAMPANDRPLRPRFPPDAPCRAPALRQRAAHLAALLALSVACLGSLLATWPAQAQTLQIITHPDRAAIDLDRPLMLALFTMRLRQWPDGRPAHVFVLPDSSPVHEQFCREQLGTYPYVLRGAWDRMIYTGTGRAPTVVRSLEEMQDKVRSTSGAIGYAHLRNPGSATRPPAGPSSLSTP